MKAPGQEGDDDTTARSGHFKRCDPGFHNDLSQHDEAVSSDVTKFAIPGERFLEWGS